MKRWKIALAIGVGFVYAPAAHAFSLGGLLDQAKGSVSSLVGGAQSGEKEGGGKSALDYAGGLVKGVIGKVGDVAKGGAKGLREAAQNLAGKAPGLVKDWLKKGVAFGRGKLKDLQGRIGGWLKGALGAAGPHGAKLQKLLLDRVGLGIGQARKIFGGGMRRSKGQVQALLRGVRKALGDLKDVRDGVGFKERLSREAARLLRELKRAGAPESLTASTNQTIHTLREALFRGRKAGGDPSARAKEVVASAVALRAAVEKSGVGAEVLTRARVLEKRARLEAGRMILRARRVAHAAPATPSTPAPAAAKIPDTQVAKDTGVTVAEVREDEKKEPPAPVEAPAKEEKKPEEPAKEEKKPEEPAKEEKKPEEPAKGTTTSAAAAADDCVAAAAQRGEALKEKPAKDLTLTQARDVIVYLHKKEGLTLHETPITCAGADIAAPKPTDYLKVPRSFHGIDLVIQWLGKEKTWSYIKKADPRMVVFLWRLTGMLHERFSVDTLYWGGIGIAKSATTVDNHAEGRGLDSAGVELVKDGARKVLLIQREWGRLAGGPEVDRLAKADPLARDVFGAMRQLASTECTHVLHPDFKDPGIRKTHQDHLHMQIGPGGSEGKRPL